MRAVAFAPDGSCCASGHNDCSVKREFFIDNLLVRIHLMIEMI